MGEYTLTPREEAAVELIDAIKKQWGKEGKISLEGPEIMAVIGEVLDTLIERVNQGTWKLDNKYHQWHVGDTLVWRIHYPGWPAIEEITLIRPVVCTHIDASSRVFFFEAGEECMTRATNMLRAIKEEAK